MSFLLLVVPLMVPATGAVFQADCDYQDECLGAVLRVQRNSLIFKILSVKVKLIALERACINKPVVVPPVNKCIFVPQTERHFSPHCLYSDMCDTLAAAH